MLKVARLLRLEWVLPTLEGDKADPNIRLMEPQNLQIPFDHLTLRSFGLSDRDRKERVVYSQQVLLEHAVLL